MYYPGLTHTGVGQERNTGQGHFHNLGELSRKPRRKEQIGGGRCVWFYRVLSPQGYVSVELIKLSH